MNIPTKGQIQDLLDEYKVPDNIRRHMQLVSKIAVFLTRMLKEAGEEVNEELLEAAALVHDLDKMLTKDSPDKEHGMLTKSILEEKGFPEVGRLAELHRFSHLIVDDIEGWEGKILNYADKRVKHDELVSLKERFDDNHVRYPQFVGSRDQKVGEKNTLKLEKEIFNKIGLKPGELGEMLNE